MSSHKNTRRGLVLVDEHALEVLTRDTQSPWMAMSSVLNALSHALRGDPSDVMFALDNALDHFGDAPHDTRQHARYLYLQCKLNHIHQRTPEACVQAKVAEVFAQAEKLGWGIDSVSY